MTLAEALAGLDPDNDAHWTSDGSPAMTAVKELTGDESVTRKMVIDLAPSLTRASARDGGTVLAPNAEPETEPVVEVEASEPPPVSSTVTQANEQERAVAFKSDLEARIADLKSERDGIIREINKVQETLDKVIDSLAIEKKSSTLTQDIQQYHHRQAELRRERARLASEAGPAPKAPDSAFNFGRNRFQGRRAVK